MGRGQLGQRITFSIEVDFDVKVEGWMPYTVKVGDTVAKVCAARGHPEMADEILKNNRLTSRYTVLRHKPKRKHDRTKLLIPRKLKDADVFEAYADIGGAAPTVTDGYAKFEIVDRPYRAGLSHFIGYGPGQMDVPITFDTIRDTPGRGQAQGEDVEDDCALLERMAGRGNFHGASTGPPPIIRVGVFVGDRKSDVVPLIPRNWQWDDDNQQAPVWRIQGLDWDNNPLRNRAGNRIRQNVTVHLLEFIQAHAVTRSATARAKAKKTTPKTSHKRR